MLLYGGMGCHLGEDFLEEECQHPGMNAKFTGRVPCGLPWQKVPRAPWPPLSVWGSVSGQTGGSISVHLRLLPQPGDAPRRGNKYVLAAQQELPLCIPSTCLPPHYSNGGQGSPSLLSPRDSRPAPPWGPQGPLRRAETSSHGVSTRDWPGGLRQGPPLGRA